MKRNIDDQVVRDFGDEWAHYQQSDTAHFDHPALYESYFGIFPFGDLPPDAEGFDMGCGSGRWAKFVAPKVTKLNCIDAAERALDVARENLRGQANCTFHLASVGDPVLPPASQDFGYSLGVLHHIPDTVAGLRACAELLKPGAPFLLYLYYDFENRPLWFRLIWRASDRLRRIVMRLPFRIKVKVTVAIAGLVYFPLARTAKCLEKFGWDVANLPLSAYRNQPFYTMKTDSLDRFGTRLEQRFSRADIAAMLKNAGFGEPHFSNKVPFWTCVARKL
jgi:SAM-dependent methyltransferase